MTQATEKPAKPPAAKTARRAGKSVARGADPRPPRRPGSVRAPAASATQATDSASVSPAQVTKQIRTWSERVLDAAGMAVGTARILRETIGAAQTLSAAAEAVKTFIPNREQSAAWDKAGRALKAFRETAGLTIRDLGEAINLRDPDLLEVAESGKIALPFEIILRLAAVLGRNDPIGFVMKLTRASNPELWKTLEELGIGKLVVHSAREREFANIYRASDAARSLSDAEFANVLAFSKAAFEMAMAFRARAAAKD